jgi:hypothetical protein
MNELDEIQQFLIGYESGEDDVPEYALRELIGRLGWESVQESLLQVLQAPEQAAHWPTVAAVFWSAVLDGRPIRADKLIALLYHRLGDAEENLIWSITTNLKDVGYLSDYQPSNDPAVLSHATARAHPRDRQHSQFLFCASH